MRARYNIYMAFLTLLLDYLAWHFSTSLLDYWIVWKNIAYFLYHFFAIPTHLKSIVKPLYRLLENKSEFGIWPFIERKLYNSIMRFVGFLFRFMTILLGLLFLGAHLLIGIACFVVWILVPPAILILLVYGFKLLLTI